MEGPSSLTMKYVNILILGETGVGKSTWINSVANYLAFSTLEEAEKKEFVTVIPASFTITDDNYQPRTITTGFDSNEVLRAGESATQRPRTYKFGYNNNSTVITLIDTPGIGDSRGPAQDKVNFQMIMDHLAYFKEVHGICILMKPDNARLNVLFEFCIKHLLTHLHRDAIKNIVFCFTNARNAFYRPGNTLPALQALLSNYKDLALPLNKETMYCLDNESFQFLVAVQQGINLEDYRDIYSKSWEISSKETHRLIDHILKLEPHQLQNTLSINDARRVVIGLTKPLADIASNIQQNISVAKDKQAEIENSKAGRHEMVQKMYIPVVQCKMVWLDHPLQVCQSPTCCKAVTLATGEKAYQYYCKKDANPTPGGGLTDKLRRMMRPSSCSRCKCPKAKHSILDYDVVEEWTQQPMPGLEEKLQQLDGDMELIRSQFLTGLLDRIKSLEDEQVKIMQVCSQFAFFLKQNAIAPYNDTMIRYLEQNIEKAKLDQKPNSAELRRLEQMKENYQKEVEILEENMAKAMNMQDMVQCTDIPVLKEELISLPINGPRIRDTLAQQEKRLASGEEMFDSTLLNNSDPRKSSLKKKFEKQASLKGGGGDRRGAKLFDVFQSPNKHRPYTMTPTPRAPAQAWTPPPSSLPPSVPSKPPCDSKEFRSLGPALTTPANFQQIGTNNNAWNVRAENKGTPSGRKEVPVQVTPIQNLRQPLQSEQVWVPHQSTITSNVSTRNEVPSSGPGKSTPARPPLAATSPQPQHVPIPTPPQSPPKPASSIPSPTLSRKGPAPPPPPPPPCPVLPIPESVGEDVIQQRSALMEDIRNNKLKLKSPAVRTNEKLGSPTTSLGPETIDMNAALERAIKERFRAHHGSVRESVDEWV